MKIGVFGGTFDPPHVGHLIVAEQARAQLHLDTVLFIPAFVPPHKQGRRISSSRHRLEMLKRALRRLYGFSIHDGELKRKGVSYTVDTLRELNKKFPDAEFYFLMGGDNTSDFAAWKKPKEILRRATIVVYPRFGGNVQRKHSNKFRTLRAPRIEISSSDIRWRVENGKSIRFLVPAAVEQYIKSRRLYRHQP